MIDENHVSQVERALRERSLGRRRENKHKKQRHAYKIRRVDFIVSLWNGESPCEKMDAPPGPVRDYGDLAEWLEKGEKLGLFIIAVGLCKMPRNKVKYRNDARYYVNYARYKGLIQ